jgi:molybdopterin synthase sulfur carrier subunit
MSIKIQIPTPMREQTGGQTEVSVAGSTVQEAVAALTAQYPGIKAKLFDGERVRPHINIFVNDEDIRYLDEMATALKDGDTVVLLPAVAGG